MYSDFGWASRVVKLTDLHCDLGYDVYFFTFDHKVGLDLSGSIGSSVGISSGVNPGSNGMNLLYIFGVPVFNDGSKAIKHGGERNLYSRFQRSDKMLSRAMMLYISNFINNG